MISGVGGWDGEDEEETRSSPARLERSSGLSLLMCAAPMRWSTNEHKEAPWAPWVPGDLRRLDVRVVGE